MLLLLNAIWASLSFGAGINFTPSFTDTYPTTPTGEAVESPIYPVTCQEKDGTNVIVTGGAGTIAAYLIHPNKAPVKKILNPGSDFGTVWFLTEMRHVAVADFFHNGTCAILAVFDLMTNDTQHKWYGSAMYGYDPKKDDFSPPRFDEKFLDFEGIADLNGDGILDVYHYSTDSEGGAKVSFGRGDGTFEAPKTVEGASVPYENLACSVVHDDTTQYRITTDRFCFYPNDPVLYQYHWNKAASKFEVTEMKVEGDLSLIKTEYVIRDAYSHQEATGPVVYVANFDDKNKTFSVVRYDVTSPNKLTGKVVLLNTGVDAIWQTVRLNRVRDVNGDGYPDLFLSWHEFVNATAVTYAVFRGTSQGTFETNYDTFNLGDGPQYAFYDPTGSGKPSLLSGAVGEFQIMEQK